MVPVVILAASERLVAVVAVPVRLPINVVAVTIPLTRTSPSTESLDEGFVVPIPRFPEVGIKTNFSLEIPIDDTPILLANVG